MGVPPAERPDLVVVTVDACSLSRSLYLVSQLRETPARLVVALTMNDVAARRGISVDPAALAEQAGVPVVAVDPRRGEGVEQLRTAIVGALTGPPPPSLGTADGHDDEFAQLDARFSWIAGATQAATHENGPRRTISDRIDAVVTAPVVGALVFLAVMWAVFQVTTTVAAPLQEALDT